MTANEPKVALAHSPWIDSCKGIGILLVVLGHTGNGTATGRLIYVFHMPLFFFLSGYLHTAQDDLERFVRKKAIHLLLPYVSFLLLLSPFYLFQEATHGGPGHSWTVDVFNMIWGGNHIRGMLGVFWFVTCLFFTQQIANLLLVKYTARRIAGIVLLLMSLSYLNSILIPQLSLPLNLHVALAALPFFLTGYLWRRLSFLSWGIGLLAILGVATSFMLTRSHIPVEYDMKDTNYGIPVLSFILALGCIAGTIQLSKWVSQISVVAAILGSIGNASIGIMFLHVSLMYLRGLRQIAGGNPFAYGLLLSAICYAITYGLMQFGLSRALFLGSVRDFDALASKIFHRKARKQSSSGDLTQEISKLESLRIPVEEKAG